MGCQFLSELPAYWHWVKWKGFTDTTVTVLSQQLIRFTSLLSANNNWFKQCKLKTTEGENHSVTNTEEATLERAVKQRRQADMLLHIRGKWWPWLNENRKYRELRESVVWGLCNRFYIHTVHTLRILRISLTNGFVSKQI